MTIKKGITFGTIASARLCSTSTGTRTLGRIDLMSMRRMRADRIHDGANIVHSFVQRTHARHVAQLASSPRQKVRSGSFTSILAYGQHSPVLSVEGIGLDVDLSVQTGGGPRIMRIAALGNF